MTIPITDKLTTAERIVADLALALTCDGWCSDCEHWERDQSGAQVVDCPRRRAVEYMEARDEETDPAETGSPGEG